MTPHSLQTVLRILADTGSPVLDADLLRRFNGAGDEAAFAELVRRHGRLVWAVCRHLTRSDAEADDAFQATFLVLLKNAKKIRDSGKLSAWLHGVAYKVCTKSRLAEQRRAARERAVAVREGHGSAVPDSAWDRALAAVHDEVAKLPDILRVPFVLCCLEGIGATEAAQQLGWKIGTFSGRLTRAKDAVLVRLEARGLTMGVIATVGVVTVPAAVTARATALARVGFAVPGSILQLSQGVIGMSFKPVKLLAAAVIFACGLGLSVGTGWVASADAQTTGGPGQPEAEVKRLQEELKAAKKMLPPATVDPNENAKRLQVDPARAEEAEIASKKAERLRLTRESSGKTREAIASFKTERSEYEFAIASDMNMNKFANYLDDRDARGWDYCGTTQLIDPKQSVMVFRRVPKGAAQLRPPTAASEGAPARAPNYGAASEFYRQFAGKADDAKSIEADIARLQGKLKEIQAKPGEVWCFPKADLPMDPVEMMNLMNKLAARKFGKERFGFTATAQGLELKGDKEVTDWATGVIKSLTGSR